MSLINQTNQSNNYPIKDHFCIIIYFHISDYSIKVRMVASDFCSYRLNKIHFSISPNKLVFNWFSKISLAQILTHILSWYIILSLRNCEFLPQFIHENLLMMKNEWIFNACASWHSFCKNFFLIAVESLYSFFFKVIEFELCLVFFRKCGYYIFYHLSTLNGV